MKRRLLLVTLISLAGAIALITLVFSLVLSRQLTAGIDRDLRARADAAAAAVSVDGGHVTFRDAAAPDAFDTGTWVITASGRILEQPPRGGLSEVAMSMARAGAATTRTTDTAALLALPVRREGRTVATVVVAISTVAYRSAERTAVLGGLLLGLSVLLMAVLSARRLISAVLEPVATMTRQAEEWSITDLERRFDVGPGDDELTALGETFNHLLARIERGVRSEQRLTAEIAHELRTPLARAGTDLQVTLRRPRDPAEYVEVLHRTRRELDHLADAITALLATAEGRPASPTRECSARDVVQLVCDQSASRAQVTLRAVGDPRVAMEAHALTRCVAPILANAARYATERIEILIEHHDAWVDITVTDDGPGLTPHELDRIFEPGVRGSAGATEQGTGLGLSLSRRLARAAGGDVTADLRHTGGARFVVTIPGATHDASG